MLEAEARTPSARRAARGRRDWRCPDCGTELTTACASCGRPVGLGWSICAWCAAELPWDGEGRPIGPPVPREAVAIAIRPGGRPMLPVMAAPEGEPDAVGSPAARRRTTSRRLPVGIQRTPHDPGGDRIVRRETRGGPVTGATAVLDSESLRRVYGADRTDRPYRLASALQPHYTAPRLRSGRSDLASASARASSVARRPCRRRRRAFSASSPRLPRFLLMSSPRFPTLSARSSPSALRGPPWRSPRLRGSPS